MGSFIFSTNRNIDEALNLFKQKGFQISTEIRDPNFTIVLYNKLYSTSKNYIKYQNSDFIIGVGTLLYKYRFGEEALDLLYNDFDTVNSIDQHLIGSFFVMVRKGGSIYFFNDRAAMYRVYYHVDKNDLIISNSFLAISSVLGSKTLNRQAMYELVMMGATESLITEIDLFDGNKIGVFDSRTLSVSIIQKPDFNAYIEINLECFEDIVKATIENLNTYMEAIKLAFDGAVASQLAGGTDTRLLACLLKHSGIKHAFCHFCNNPLDLKIADAVSKGEKRKLLVHPSSKMDNIDNVTEYQSFLKDNVFRFESLFSLFGSNSSDWEEPHLSFTSNKKYLVLGGMGGEIFFQDWTTPWPWDVWERKRHSISIKEFIQKNSSPYSMLFINKEDERDFTRRLTAKIQQILDIDTTKLDYVLINKLSQLYIARLFISPYVSYANTLTYFLAPFTDARIAYNTFCIPPEFRIKRRLSVAMIKTLDPILANYPFVSRMKTTGDSFLKIDEFSEVHNISDLIRDCPFFPRRLYDALWYYKHKKDPLPFYFQREFIVDLFGEDKLIIERFINIERCRNVLFLNKIYSLELLIRCFGIEV